MKKGPRREHSRGKKTRRKKQGAVYGGKKEGSGRGNLNCDYRERGKEKGSFKQKEAVRTPCLQKGETLGGVLYEGRKGVETNTAL